ncbi:tryptophan transporter [Lederbergia lenta]|uniref:Tryptophan transporter n=1 Tax=Lederbergia lenta TaxID=1467 RepID=A0A2X4WD85_LEDLE|nr:tryptophan transporter [Lederbergia lenta]MCM3110513.1 tryptophan transporter [Lederbergia lenta]MEC2323921.1 tryptophan transporter [Lederbergia lenta]SQI61013.1 tryptophan transporter [Lederbergia lenta]
MNTRTLVVLAMLMGIGTALHFIIPPVILGVTPDMMLSMMFLGIVLFPEKKNVLLLGIVTGLLTALTTGFPMGQIPNIIDKPITAFVFFGLYVLVVKRLPGIAGITILSAICTIVSGILFLGSAWVLFELPDAFIVLFAGAVLPATLLNAIVLFILYPIVKTILKRTKLLKEVHV